MNSGNGKNSSPIIRALLLALIVLVNSGFALLWIFKPTHETREVLKWSVILSFICFGGLMFN